LEEKGKRKRLDKEAIIGGMDKENEINEQIKLIRIKDRKERMRKV